MANKQVFLKYYIHLTDKARVAELQGGTGLGGAIGATIEAPYNPGPPEGGAAVAYAEPSYPPALALIKDDGVTAFQGPCITSEWFETEANFPTNVAKFTRKSGGWFGIPFLFGDTTDYFWRGEWVYTAPLTQSDGALYAPMRNRMWIDGFETGGRAEAEGTISTKNCRGASRHLQGFGMKISNATSKAVHTVTGLGHLAAGEVWERFYMRPHKFPTAATRFWTSQGATSATAGAQLDLLPSGQIMVSNVSNVGAVTQMLTLADPLVAHAWHKVDLIYKYGSSGGGVDAYVVIYINGVLKATVTGFTAGIGLAQIQNAAGSTLGNAAAGNSMTVDYDDWIAAEVPVGTVSGGLAGDDFLNGSRVAFVGAEGFAASNDASFGAGVWQLLKQRIYNPLDADVLSSTVASARLSITTDALRAVDHQVGSLGYVAMVVGVVSKQAAVTDGQLGYTLPGGTEVLSAITQATSLGANAVAYFPTDLPAPVVGLDGLELTFVKGTTTDSCSVQSLAAVVELIGTFGPEDITPGTGDPSVQTYPSQVIHNAPYPNTPWAALGTPPALQPVVIVGGTYVGNGTAQDLSFRAPVHFLWIRNTSGAIAGTQWWSTMNGAHLGGQESETPSLIIEALKDPAFAGAVAEDDQETSYLVRIAGSSTAVNAAGITYQYIAFCDPAMRFCEAGALDVSNDTASYLHSLINENFTPEHAFVQVEPTSAATTVRLYGKGLGSSAAGASPLNATETANALSFAMGTLTAAGALALSLAPQAAFIAFRRDDGSGDAGIPRVLQLASYVGDGSASRTVSLAPLSGRRPLFAIVIPDNAASIYRDPSHTGTTSQAFPLTANASTGITAGGIDSLSVGSALNASGHSYSVFVFPGDTTAGNNGWSVNGEFIPVDPVDPVVNGPYDPTPPDPEAVPPPVEPPPPAGGDSTNFGTQCIVASTKIINVALAHLGVSKQVSDIVNELTAEASAARLAYSDDLDAVLRDFDWPFATKYADLVLVAGSETAPVNGDWVYSYRAPSDMIKARRIVNPDLSRREYDPDPPEFRVGGDDTGTLIYSNQVDAELEYTRRPPCAATAGDALFRAAVGWRHAASLAPVLSRDAQKLSFCAQMYQIQLGKAATIGAQETQQAKNGDADWIRGRE